VLRTAISGYFTLLLTTTLWRKTVYISDKLNQTQSYSKDEINMSAVKRGLDFWGHLKDKSGMRSKINFLNN